MDPFIGEIKMVGFPFAPNGYAFCDGSAISIAQNSALFALLGVTFGGNGVSVFNLPDFRGRSPVGMGNGPGLTPITQGQVAGTESATILQTQMPAHTHTAATSIAIPAGTADGASPTPGPTTYLAQVTDPTGSRNPASLYLTGTPDTTLLPFSPAITVAPSGGGLPVPTRNPFLGTNFIIAMSGVFPSRP